MGKLRFSNLKYLIHIPLFVTFTGSALALIGCKGNIFSRSKSYVGLRSGGVEGAPTFSALQEWFNNEDRQLTNQVIASQGRHKTEMTPDRLRSLPEAYKTGFRDYFIQQLDRIGEFEKSFESEARLKILFYKEAAELKDIILVVLRKNHKPQTGDRLAIFLSDPVNRALVNLSTLDFQKKAFLRPLYDIVNDIDEEERVFADNLIKKYIEHGKANQKFRDEIAMHCQNLKTLIASFGGRPDDSKCSNLNASSSETGRMNLDDSFGSYDMSQSSGGPYAIVPEMLGNVTGVQAPGTQPELAIFRGKDLRSSQSSTAMGGTQNGSAAPSQNNSYGNQGHSYSNYNPANPSGSMMPGDLAPDMQQFISVLSMIMSPQSVAQLGAPATYSDTNLNNLTITADRAIDLKEPSIDCVKAGLKDLALINCQQYLATLSPGVSAFQNRRAGSSKSETNNFALDEYGLPGTNGGYNFKLISDFYTPVQNQGSEGACSAYALMHTIEATAAAASKTRAQFSAAEQWARQGRQITPNAAIEAALGRSFSGFQIADQRMLDASVQAFKRAIDQNRAIYAMSNVDLTWSSYFQLGTIQPLSCGEQGTSAHAFSIQGYDDVSRLFIIKNSWGETWGDHGYGYLPYDCIPRMVIQQYDVATGQPAGTSGIAAYDLMLKPISSR